MNEKYIINYKKRTKKNKKLVLKKYFYFITT